MSTTSGLKHGRKGSGDAVEIAARPRRPSAPGKSTRVDARYRGIQRKAADSATCEPAAEAQAEAQAEAAAEAQAAAEASCPDERAVEAETPAAKSMRKDRDPAREITKGQTLDRFFTRQHMALNTAKGDASDGSPHFQVNRGVHQRRRS